MQLTQIQFRQTWSSANYRDVGPKRMTIVDEGGGPLIVREEMLESAKSERVTPVDDAEVELLHCVYKDVDARWRIVDDKFDVVRVENQAHAGADAIRVVLADHEVLALCKDGKLIARNDSVSLPSLDAPSCSPETVWSLESDYMELKPGVKALAFVGHLRVLDDGSGEEGCEDSIDGEGLELFVPVKGALSRVFGTFSQRDSCNFTECTNRSCAVETGKRGRSGWFDLIETCDFTDIDLGHVKRSYRKIMRYEWDGYSYSPRSPR